MKSGGGGGKTKIYERTVVNGKKALFRHRYGATQAANHPSLTYYNTCKSIFNMCEPWMGSFVRCPIAMAKVLFPIDHALYVVGHQHVHRVTEKYGRARSVKTL